MPYDLDALKNDMDHLEKEIKIFKEKLLELMERRIQLQALIEEAEKRKEMEMKANGTNDKLGSS